MNLLLERIETKRLLLVPADTKYANEIYSNFDMETTKYMYPKPADNINETLDFLNNSICEMRKGTNRLLTNPAVSRLYNDKRVITYIIGSNRCADL